MKLKNELKAPPTHIETSTCKGGTGINKDIRFHYLDKEDFLNVSDKFNSPKPVGVGIEMENGEEFSLSQLEDILSELSSLSVLTESRQFSRFRGTAKNFSIDYNDSPAQIRNQIIEILSVAVYPNLSMLIGQEPHVDQTVNYGKGGIEIIFEPVSLKALPILRVEIARVLHWRKKFGMLKDLPDASTHLNMSLDMWGNTMNERASSLTNFWNFIWFNREFMLEISNRKGIGTDYADMLLAIGDPLNSYNQKRQDMLFTGLKDKAFQMLIEEGKIGPKSKINAAGSADDRVKGFCNTTVNGNNEVVEFRQFASFDNADEYIEAVQFFFAINEMSVKPWRIGLTSIEQRKESFPIFLKTVYDKKNGEYSFIWNKLLKMSSIKAQLAASDLDLTPTPIEPLDMEKVLSFDYSDFIGKEPAQPKESVFNVQEESPALEELVPVIEVEKEPEVQIVEEVIKIDDKIYTCCDCSHTGPVSDFQDELNDDIENFLGDPDDFEQRDEDSMWCNECYKSHNKDDDEDDEDEEENAEVQCEQCGDIVPEEQSFLLKTKICCESCYSHLTS